MKRDPESLRTEWMSLRASGTAGHALEMSEKLGVSECEMLASACGASGDVKVTRLAAEWAKLVALFPKLGTVKTVTRNRDAVIEVVGTYGNVEVFGVMGQSVSSIDLRLFFGRWRHGFAVDEETKHGRSRGMQFFDASGRAIHKLYLREASDIAVFDALVREHTSTDQSPSQLVEPVEIAPPPKADTEIDIESLRTAWRAMTDTHQFFGLLRVFGVARTQALRLAPEDFAIPLTRASLDLTLRAAKEAALPFMVFVGNPGVIQIHTGAIKNVVVEEPWINVLDPGFDLHVRTDRIAEAWLVRKPTSDGKVTSLELYDDAGEQLALLVGKRKPGTAEAPAWRGLVEALPRLTASAG